MTRRGFLAGAAGLGAAMAAAAATRARAEPAASHPPLGAFVTVEGLRIHYVSEGEGPPVVLLHGASGNLRDFTFSLTGRLAAMGMRAVAFDRPGLGWSDRPAERGWDPAVQARVLRAASAALGVEGPVVVGHSWGGAAAMAWAVDAPESLRGVLSVSGATYPWGTGVGALYQLAATDALGWAVSGAARLWYGSGDPRELLGGIFEPNAVPPGYADYVGVPLALRSDAFRNNAEDLTHLDAALAAQAPRYRGLKVPVEAVHGLADETVWASVHSEPLTSDVAHGRLTLLEGVGHMPHHVREDAVTAAVARLAGR
ncbi:alpha/beta fold hydrolase [Rubrimonas cliftonensis]|uniref:alpha/beta fold hydrolase n=1 Tax=Rubrimonas cliftonensis TaxID=89524 RepID=UPI001587DECD|nr:alpha/beta hydrolase [Rubrimonas cliftonensis]